VADRPALFASAFVEFVGFHQVITFVRATSVFRVRSHHGKYWTTERAGLAAGDDGHAVVGQARNSLDGGA